MQTVLQFIGGVTIGAVLIVVILGAISGIRADLALDSVDARIRALESDRDEEQP